MRHHSALTAFVAIAALAAAIHAASPRAQRETTQRHVFIGVTDARGQAAEGLTPADVIVREDDVVREVLSIAPAPPPSHVALIVDNTNDVNPLLIALRASLLKFVQSMAALPAPPSMKVTTIADRPTTAVPYTTSDIVLERGIQRLFPRPGGGAYLLDAVMEACQELHKMKAARPVIVAFVMDSSPAFSNQVHTQVADALKEASASLWTIELEHTGPRASQEERERTLLVSDVTRWSGGANTPIISQQGLEKAFATTASAILGRYDVTYGHPDTLIPPARLSVEMRDPSLRVTVPRWPGR